MFGSKYAVLSVVIYVVASEGIILQRTRRQDVPEEGSHVIDNIFNIPITAIKQTASAVQSFSPENSGPIDSVLNIPVSTLEAVGSLVKATSGQRRRNAEELQRIRQDRRDKILAQRNLQRLRREQQQQDYLKQQQMRRTIKFNNKDPFGVNALSFLVSNHGILGGIQGVFGGHGGHGALGGHGGHGGLGGHGGHGGLGGPGGLGGLGGHGSHGGHGGLGGHGSHGQGGINNQHTYEVHENVEEDTNYMWHGITAGFGTFSDSRPTSTHISIQNKVAPKDERPNRYLYDTSRVQNKIMLNANKLEYDDELPLENKIAPKSSRIIFQQ